MAKGRSAYIMLIFGALIAIQMLLVMKIQSTSNHYFEHHQHDDVNSMLRPNPTKECTLTKQQTATVPVPPKSFGACLIVMDDNHHLPEWIAYHYQVLPLRRLIVAIDPRSKTSPSKIFERYRSRGLMDIVEWDDIDFMPPYQLVAHRLIANNDSERIENLYIDRQKHFYARCMAMHKIQNQSWVAIIDSDEYILPNPHADDKYRLPSITAPTSKKQQSKTTTDAWVNSTIFELLEATKTSTGSTPMAQHKFFEKGCVPMHRLQYGTKESTDKQVQTMVPNGLDGRDFVTMRWRYHAGLENSKFNKLVKSMVDLSGIEEVNFNRDNMNPHLPLKTHCHLKYIKLPNAESPFLVHHYIGTLEQFSYRDDVREKRREEEYHRLHFDTYQDDFIRPWLQKFVEKVGIATAKELLRGSGKLEPK